MDKSQNPDFAVVIPVLNEAGRIGRTIAEILKHVQAEIVVIDDGSMDGTADEASASGALVLRHPFNLGYGAALQTGMKYALGRGYSFAVQMDGDGQHDPAYIKPLLAAVQGDNADVAIGSRFLGLGNYRLPIFRKLGVIFFRMITSLVTGRKITDPTSGFQALNRRAMEFCCSEAFPIDFPDADVLIMLHRRGLRFTEVPVEMRQSTKHNTMHSGLVPVYYLFKMVLSIIVTLLRRN